MRLDGQIDPEKENPQQMYLLKYLLLLHDNLLMPSGLPKTNRTYLKTNRTESLLVRNTLLAVENNSVIFTYSVI